MNMEYMNKRSPYEIPRARSNLTNHNNRSLSNTGGSTCRRDDSSIGVEESSSAAFIYNSETSEGDADSFKQLEVMKCPELLSLQLARLKKTKPWDHVNENDVIFFTRSSVSASKVLSNKREGQRERVRRPSTVPVVEADEKSVEVITLAK